MATGIIMETGVKTATYTQNGLTFDVAKYGRVCVITCSAGSTTSAVAANGTLLTLNEDFIPTNTVFTQNQTSFASRIVAITAGSVNTVTAANAGTSFRFTICYITAN